jgi:hypothetical protein
LGIYLANGRALPGADGAAARYLPLSILCEGDLDFDELPLGSLRDDGSMRLPYWLLRGRAGHLYPTFGVLPGVLVTPLFAVARAVDPVFSYERVLALGKLGAALLAAAAGALLWVPLRARLGLRPALVLVAVHGLGTSVWSLGSQALWQHTAAAPFLALALLLAHRPRALHWLGMALGLAVLCRPSNLLLALPLVAWVALHHRRSLPGLLAMAAPTAALQIAMNLAFFEHPLRFGQALVGPVLAASGVAGGAVWGFDPWQQVAMWLSPSRGLLAFSPVLALGLWGLCTSLRRGGDALLRWSLLGVVAVVALHGLRFDWDGGWGYGYRNTLDVVPFLVLGVCPVLGRVPRWLFALLFGASVLVQVGGAVRYDIVIWNATHDLRQDPAAAWRLADSQPLAVLRDLRWVPFEGQDLPRRTFEICPVRQVPP